MRQKKSGFSLLELMIVVGIGSVVSLGLGTMLTQLFKGLRSARISQDAENMANGITLALAKGTCTTALVPNPTMAAGWTSVALTEVRLGTTVLASTTALVGNLITNSITLTPVAGPFDIKVNTTVPPVAPAVEDMKRYVVRLRIQQEKQSSGGTNTGGDSMGQKTFFLSVIVRPSAGDTMYSCFGGEDRDFLEEMCERQLGGVYDENENPSCRLQRLALADGSFAMRDTMLDTSTPQGRSRFSVTDETTLHTVPAEPTLTVRSINNQAVLNIQGAGEDNSVVMNAPTHSSVNLLNEDDTARWVIGYKSESMTGSQSGGLIIAKFAPVPSFPGYETSFTAFILTKYGQVRMGHNPVFQPDPIVAINGNTQMIGNLTLSPTSPPSGSSGPGNLTVSGTLSAGSAANITGDLSTGANMSVAGNLSVGGTITAVGTITSSDATLKKNINDIDDMLARISDLRPVSFEWKDKRKPAGAQYGFIAQEVKKSFPELVVKTPSGTLGVKYDQLSPILLKAMQEMIVQNQELRSRVEALEQRCK